MGMITDKSDVCFGNRSWRYACIVNDNAIEKWFIEPKDSGENDPYGETSPENVAKYLGLAI